MFLLISENEIFNGFALQALGGLGKVTAVASYGDSVELLNNINIKYAIVYAGNDLEKKAKLCCELRAVRNNLKLITAVIHDTESASRYRDIPECDIQLNLPCTADDLTAAIRKLCPDSFSVLRLTFGTERKIVVFDGQHLRLSKTDYAILRIIAVSHPLPVLPDSLCGFFDGGMSRNCIAAHICGINKNADKLAHRRLVISSKKGYSLNPLM